MRNCITTVINSQYKLLTLFCAIVFCLIVSGKSDASDEPALAVFNGKSIDLSTHIEYIKDRRKIWTIDDILKQENWIKNLNGSFNFGFDNNAYWLRIRIHNAKKQEVNLVLNTQSELTDFIDAYLINNKNKVVKSWKTGDRRVFDSRPIHSNDIAFPIHLEALESLTLYMKIDSYDGLHEILKPVLSDTNDFIHSNQVANFFLGAFFGLLFTMVLYNLFLFASTKDVAYGLYSLYVFMFLIWSLTFRGYAFEFLWPNYPKFNHILIAFSATSMAVCLTFFLVRYMNLKQSSPAIYKLATYMSYASILLIPIILSDSYALSFSLIFPYVALSLVVTLIYTTYLVFQGSREARFVLLSFGVLSISVLAYMIMFTGIVTNNIFANNLPLIGAAFEALLIAFGLADKMNILQQKQQRTERKARMAQESINEKLSQEVTRRTQELEELNNELYRLSVVDELTQTFNRRLFNQQLKKKLENENNASCSFALNILDIDYFKRYNDYYGHQEGDKALMMVADCIKKISIPEADLSVYRIGGEEFAIIISFHSPIEKIIEHIKKLNIQVQSLGLPHNESPHEVVTISQGLLILEQAEGKPNAIFKHADKLLYEAKEKGRNKTIFDVIKNKKQTSTEPF